MHSAECKNSQKTTATISRDLCTRTQQIAAAPAECGNIQLIAVAIGDANNTLVIGEQKTRKQSMRDEW
jgi:hypothetical protein